MSEPETITEDRRQFLLDNEGAVISWGKVTLKVGQATERGGRHFVMNDSVLWRSFPVDRTAAADLDRLWQYICTDPRNA